MLASTIRRTGPRRPAWTRRLLLVGVIGAATPVGGASQVFMTQAEALALAFPPPATIERQTAFLDEAELEAARRLAGPGVQVDQRVVTYYVARRVDRPVGVAYFDAHRVRTMREVAMIVVLPGGTIERVEVLSFLEPPEYMATGPWIEQLDGRALTDDLAVDRAIVNLTGATLTAGALTRASRRVLSLHQVIDPFRATD